MTVLEFVLSLCSKAQGKWRPRLYRFFFPFGAFFRQIRTRTEPNMVMASTMGGINRRVRSSAQIDDAGLPRAWSASDADFDAEVPSSSTSTSTAYHARASSSEGLESARHGSAPDEHQGVNTPARRHPGETLLQFCVDAAAGAAADGAGDADAGKRGELALRVADDDVRSFLFLLFIFV